MSPEEAARGDIPEQYVTVLGVRIDNDRATVWMLTNDRAPYQAYTVDCYLDGAGWEQGIGGSGLGESAPPEVLKAAAERGWE
jgi:hypothetical protein